MIQKPMVCIVPGSSGRDLDICAILGSSTSDRLCEKTETYGWAEGGWWWEQCKPRGCQPRRKRVATKTRRVHVIVFPTDPTDFRSDCCFCPPLRLPLDLPSSTIPSLRYLFCLLLWQKPKTALTANLTTNKFKVLKFQS